MVSADVAKHYDLEDLKFFHNTQVSNANRIGSRCKAEGVNRMIFEGFYTFSDST